MNYIVFDLEWNQSSGGRDFENPRMPFEIIEIGAVKLDKKFNIIDTLRYMHFKKEIEKNMVNACMNNKMKEYLSLVQDDIDELNQKAQEEIEKAKREIGGIK